MINQFFTSMLNFIQFTCEASFPFLPNIFKNKSEKRVKLVVITLLFVEKANSDSSTELFFI